MNPPLRDGKISDAMMATHLRTLVHEIVQSPLFQTK